MQLHSDHPNFDVLPTLLEEFPMEFLSERDYAVVRTARRLVAERDPGFDSSLWCYHCDTGWHIPRDCPTLAAIDSEAVAAFFGIRGGELPLAS